MTTVIIKLDDTFDVKTIDKVLRKTFDTHKNIIFIFDIVSATILDWRLLLSILPLLRRYNKEIESKLDKSIIIAPYKWQHWLLSAFFSVYTPIKPYEIINQNHGLSSSVLL